MPNIVNPARIGKTGASPAATGYRRPVIFLFGRKTKYRPLAQGGRVRRRCPECGQDAEFVACERVHTYEAYFVGLFDTRKTVWVCTACKEEVDTAEELPPGEDDAAKQRAELEATERARAARRQQLAEKAEAVKQKVEDELAALKAKLGRPK